MGKQIIVTVMGKALEHGGKASEELIDRCSVAAKVMRERQGQLIIPTGGDPKNIGVTEAQKMTALLIEMGTAQGSLRNGISWLKKEILLELIKLIIFICN